MNPAQESRLRVARVDFFDKLEELQALAAEVQRLGAKAFPEGSPVFLLDSGEGLVRGAPQVSLRCTIRRGAVRGRPGWILTTVLPLGDGA